MVKVVSVIFLNLLMMSMVASAADIDAGRQLYSTSCVACHGAQGEGNDGVGGPALAGQDAVYLDRQLVYFAEGVRGTNEKDAYGPQMSAMVALTKDATVRENLVQYLASLSSPEVVASTSGDVGRGYKVYQASCGACHGGNAQGNPALNSPKLLGLSEAYLRRQYQYFLDGVRGSHADDKLGRQMKMIAATVSEEQKIADVIAHITSLRDQ